MKRILHTLILSLISLAVFAQSSPKREFRGAWLHVIGPVRYTDKGTEGAKRFITDQLDKLQQAGVNAVIFQVRPCADALYVSDIEPWSQFLTGCRGKAPSPHWDPLQFAIDEAHKRGMELHAWLNPYRISTNANEVLPQSHIAAREPWRTFKYDNKLFFDPGIPENRKYIEGVVRDIVGRYDVDAIHIDDYFYPYPVAGKDIPDQATYAKYGNGMPKNDWRRHNVDLLIEELYTTIKSTKPWVRFGVSPFGIWRNKKSDPRGSDSNGLQNYDALYADVLLWTKNKWVDYIAPQLYWELDHAQAPSRKLVQWWNDNVHNSDLYIGQDVQRTMSVPDPGNKDRNELDTKVRMTRRLPNVKGNVWWHGYWVTGNYKGAADSLAMKYQSTIALPPAYGDTGKRPRGVTDLKIERDGKDTYLVWKAPRNGHTADERDVVKYVVYEFFPGETQDLDDPQAIVAMTPMTRVKVDPERGLTFAITALDRMNRESEPIFIYNK